MVDRGLLDAEAARELITITPEEEATLLTLVETDFDKRLVRAAVAFRRQVLDRFDRLLAPPADTGLTATEQGIVSFLLKSSEREARRELQHQRECPTP